MELCSGLHGIGLLVLNTEGTGMDTPALVHAIRKTNHDLSVLHIGRAPIAGMPLDVVHLAESFTAEQLLETVRTLVPGTGGRSGNSHARLFYSSTQRVTSTAARRRV